MYYDDIRGVTNVPTRPNRGEQGGIPVSTDTQLRNWEKGVKRDPSIFPELKSDNGWTSWNRAFVANAHAQGVEDVLNPDFTPVGEGVALFQKKQDYLYSVLNRVLKTDTGKDAVRKYESTRDAQQVYKEVKEYGEVSTRADIERTDTLTYLATAKLGDGSWKNDTYSFILHWIDKVREYEKNVESEAEKLSDNQKATMLQVAVRNIDDLRKVQETARQLKVTGTDTKWTHYLGLLKSAAQSYDKVHRRGKGHTRTRQVYHADILEDDGIDDANGHDVHDIDTHVSVFQAAFEPKPTGDPSVWRPRKKGGAARKQPNDGTPARLRRDQWQDLSTQARETWDKLSDDEKRTILRYVKYPSSTGPGLKAYAAEIIDNLGDPNVCDFIHVNATLLETELDQQHPDNDNSILVNAASSLAPGDPRRLLSTKQAGPRQANVHEVKYNVSRHVTNRLGALIDRGANGPVIGDDLRVFHKLPGTVCVQGIDNHQVTTSIGHAGGVVTSNKGDLIVIIHNGAIHGKDKSILACTPMESYGVDVNDRSVHTEGGMQRLTTLEGYIIPLNIKDGLTYLPCRPYTNQEWDQLPHVFLNSPDPWDPTMLDHDAVPDGEFFDAATIDDGKAIQLRQNFDEVGTFTRRHMVNESQLRAILQGKLPFPPTHDLLLYEVSATRLERAPEDPSKLRSKFLYASDEVIRRTLDATTQLARIPQSTFLRTWFRSPNPALNVPRRHEPVATDTTFADTAALCSNGVDKAQFFVGTRSKVVDIFPMKTEKQFPNTLEDVILQRGAMEKLISDSAQVEQSRHVKDILRTYGIASWQSEAYHQHQNFAERRWQDVKRMTNLILDRSGAPPEAWLLAAQYVAFVLNHTALRSLNWRTPMECLTGNTPDISVILRFTFWEPVFYPNHESHFPSASRELRGRIVGFSETVGHALTYKVLSDDSQRVLHRSSLRSALDPAHPNLRLPPVDGEIADAMSTDANEPDADEEEQIGNTQQDDHIDTAIEPKESDEEDDPVYEAARQLEGVSIDTPPTWQRCSGHPSHTGRRFHEHGRRRTRNGIMGRSHRRS